jgi:hypothetical protein
MSAPVTTPAPLPSQGPQVDADLAHQARPGHGIPSQDPEPAAQQPLEPGEAEREAGSVLAGGGVLVGAAAGAALGTAMAGPVGAVVGGTVGAVAGALGGAAAGPLLTPDEPPAAAAAPPRAPPPAPPPSR